MGGSAGGVCFSAESPYLSLNGLWSVVLRRVSDVRFCSRVWILLFALKYDFRCSTVIVLVDACSILVNIAYAGGAISLSHSVNRRTHDTLRSVCSIAHVRVVRPVQAALHNSTHHRAVQPFRSNRTSPCITLRFPLDNKLN